MHDDIINTEENKIFLGPNLLVRGTAKIFAKKVTITKKGKIIFVSESSLYFYLN